MIPLEITKLIPQREPILMVDRLERAEGDSAETLFLVREDNFFLEEGERLAEIGIIEHIAQSASALFGYKAFMAGVPEPEVRYIGEVKKFRCYRCPAVGETLHTVITVEMEMEGITLVRGETRIGEELIAETQMKLSDKT